MPCKIIFIDIIYRLRQACNPSCRGTCLARVPLGACNLQETSLLFSLYFHAYGHKTFL